MSKEMVGRIGKGKVEGERGCYRVEEGLQYGWRIGVVGRERDELVRRLDV